MVITIMITVITIVAIVITMTIQVSPRLASPRLASPRLASPRLVPSCLVSCGVGRLSCGLTKAPVCHLAADATQERVKKQHNQPSSKQLSIATKR